MIRAQPQLPQQQCWQQEVRGKLLGAFLVCGEPGRNRLTPNLTPDLPTSLPPSLLPSLEGQGWGVRKGTGGQDP